MPRAGGVNRKVEDLRNADFGSRNRKRRLKLRGDFEEDVSLKINEHVSTAAKNTLQPAQHAQSS
jgi:hypothetical protein